MSDEKIVSDAIFGLITLKSHIIVIIDTPEFQRLRNIAQLGTVPFVYPTAHHSRFEHCIGTYWLASKLVTQLQKQLRDENAEKQITNKDVMCVEIAALCHDIGHGPFSHFWDKTLLPALFGTNFTKHEKQFLEMWQVIKRNEKVREMMETFDLDETLIANLIDGGGTEILKNIISNSESGMDVDKWDYLARDSSYLGHSSTNYRIDIDRMIHFARANKDKDGTWKIAFRDSEALNMLRVYQLRHYLYKTAYYHRTAMAINEMLLDGIRECIDQGVFTLDSLKSADWIIKNTDSIFWSNSGSIPLFKRILNRDLYRPIFEAVKYEIGIDTKKIKASCLEFAGESHTIRLVDCVLKLGNYDSNPMLNIPFYSKSDLKTITKYTSLPSYLNMNCDETKIIVISLLTKEKWESGNDGDSDKIRRMKEYFVNNNWDIRNVKRQFDL